MCRNDRRMPEIQAGALSLPSLLWRGENDQQASLNGVSCIKNLCAGIMQASFGFSVLTCPERVPQSSNYGAHIYGWIV